MRKKEHADFLHCQAEEGNAIIIICSGHNEAGMATKKFRLVSNLVAYNITNPGKST